MQCSQKVGQKKWSHNSSQKTSRTSTPTPPLQKGLLNTRTCTLLGLSRHPNYEKNPATAAAVAAAALLPRQWPRQLRVLAARRLCEKIFNFLRILDVLEIMDVCERFWTFRDVFE